ncbi:MAG: DUF1697 domain-containing protein [Chloroflexota bacterium]
MPTYISLLRGINVGGNKKIKMADLRALYADLGYGDVKSVLQSGNVVFDAHGDDPAAIRRAIEGAIQDAFGFEAGVLVLTVPRFRDAVNAHPFTEAHLAQPSFVRVVFLDELPTPDKVEALMAAIPGDEQVWHVGRALYVFYPSGGGKSKLDLNRMERALGVTGTARNWNTVQKLLGLVE